MSSHPEQAKAYLREALEERDMAASRYEAALRYAVEAGLSNRKIAEICCVTEAAIRMYRKRHHIR